MTLVVISALIYFGFVFIYWGIMTTVPNYPLYEHKRFRFVIGILGSVCLSVGIIIMFKILLGALK